MSSTEAPDTVPALAQAWLDVVLESDPLDATLMGYRTHDAHLPDLSREAQERTRHAFAAIRTRVDEIDTHGLSEADIVTRGVLLALDDAHADSSAADVIAFTVAAFPISPASVLVTYLRMITITSESEAEAYLHRLSEIPRYLAQASTRLSEGRQAGLSAVRRLVSMAIAQIDDALAAEPSVFAVEPIGSLGDTDDWRSRRDAIIRHEVEPAFAQYRAMLETEALPSSRGDDQPGLVHLPDGLDRYTRLCRVHTTTALSPEHLHRVGRTLLAQVHEEFQQVGRSVLGTTDVADIFQRLQEDPALRWTSSEAIIKAAEDAVRRAEGVAPHWFARVPQAVCALATIPEWEAAGSPPTYYMPPAIDGSRPGTYFTNVSTPTARTSFDLEAVAFHEAVPGHHFQISLAQENAELPELRRLPMFTAYVEGWGLYAERLADEMGLYSSDMQRLGMLSADAWRASRLVVDTGIHAFGWSRDEAVAFMRENTPVAPVDVESEIDRYIAYPGQALSYMTGRLEIIRMRDLARAALGAAFDIRDFHEQVLGHGALPLAVLDQVISTWCAGATLES